MNTPTGTFWMVYLASTYSGAPTYKHGSFESAKTEALRLMRVHKCKAYVLQATYMFEPPKEYEETRLVPEKDEMPF